MTLINTLTALCAFVFWAVALYCFSKLWNARLGS